jgi:curved DNA-binding protein CbpA
MPDLYEILGLRSGATQEQVKATFHRLAKASHPDVNADDATAEKRFKEINHAYEILSDPWSRAAYDLGLQHMRAKKSPRHGARDWKHGCCLPGDDRLWPVFLARRPPIWRAVARRPRCPRKMVAPIRSPTKTARARGPRIWRKSASCHQRPTAEGHRARSWTRNLPHRPLPTQR